MRLPWRRRVPTPLTRVQAGLAAAFLISGTIHLIRPAFFEPIVPRGIPARPAVLLSGLAELACAAGLAVPSTRERAGRASAALLAAVFPANVRMAKDAARRARRHPGPGTIVLAAATIARLPLQWPLITAASTAGQPRR